MSSRHAGGAAHPPAKRDGASGGSQRLARGGAHAARGYAPEGSGPWESQSGRDGLGSRREALDVEAQAQPWPATRPSGALPARAVSTGRGGATPGRTRQTAPAASQKGLLRRLPSEARGWVKLRIEPPARPSGSVPQLLLHSSYMLHPDSKFIRRWTIALATILLFTAVVTPYEVAFLSNVPGPNPLYAIDRFVDLFFLLDMFVSCSTGYYDPALRRTIMLRSTVVRRYVSSYLLTDVVSIVPFEEVITALGDSGASHTQLLHITRLVRLVKLLRIMRASHMLERFQDTLTIKYGVIKLWKYSLGTLFICHWLACVWALIPVVNSSDCSWINRYFAHEPINVGGCYPLEHEPTNPEKYIAALYWAVMTVATVGYGDVQPQNSAERVYCICAMFIGASVFAFVLGNVTDVVAAMNIRSNEYEALMDTANCFVSDTGLSPEMAHRLRAFLRNLRNGSSSPEWQKLSSLLSPAIRQDISLELNRSQLKLVSFFDAIPDLCLAQLALVLVPEFYPPMEVIIHAEQKPDRMYIVRNGIIACASTIRTRDTVVGEDMIFKTRPYGYTAASISFSEVLRLSKEDLEAVLVEFPAARVLIRQKSIRMIFREQVKKFVTAAKKTARLVEQMKQEAARQEKRRAKTTGSLLKARPAANDGVSITHVLRSLHRREARSLLAAIAAMEPTAGFPVLCLLIRATSPLHDRTLCNAASQIQRVWRSFAVRRAELAAIAAAMEADHMAVQAEVERDRDAPATIGVLGGNERVVVVYGPAPMAAEQLRGAVHQLRQQVVLLQKLVLQHTKGGHHNPGLHAGHSSHELLAGRDSNPALLSPAQLSRSLSQKPPLSSLLQPSPSMKNQNPLYSEARPGALQATTPTRHHT